MNLLKLLLATLLLQGAAVPQPPTGSIEGIVVGTTGEALPRVSVTLVEIIGQDELTRISASSSIPALLERIPTNALSGIRLSSTTKSYSAMTGPDGKFVLENLPASLFLLQADRQGYVSAQYGQNSPNSKPSPIVLTAGQKMKNVRLVMTPNGTITGRIVNRNGDPVSRARVQALQSFYSTLEGRSLAVIESVTTNDLGEYRLFWLPPGSYFVSAVPMDIQVSSFPQSFLNVNLIWDSAGLDPNPNSVVSSRTLKDGTIDEEAPVPVYYPGVFAAQQAMPVVVRGGTAISGINITAAPARVHRIRGVTVNGISGQRQAMSIALIPRDGFSGAILNTGIRSANSGAFEITGVVQGSYLLAVSEGGIRGLFPIEVGNADVTNVIVTAAAPLTLKGRFTMESGPLPVLPYGSARTIRLSSVIPQLPSVITGIAADGTFSFDVFPGDYQVSTQNGNPIVKSIRLGSQDVSSDVLHIRSQPEGQLEIVATSALGIATGRVVDERRNPVSNATVVAIPDPPFRQLYFTPQIDASGKFQFGAMPGQYKVFAWEDVSPGAWLDPDFLRSYDSRARIITITGSGSETIDVPVIPYVR